MALMMEVQYRGSAMSGAHTGRPSDHLRWAAVLDELLEKAGSPITQDDLDVFAKEINDALAANGGKVEFGAIEG